MIFFTENKIYMVEKRDRKGSCNERLKEGIGGGVDRALDLRLGGHGVRFLVGSEVIFLMVFSPFFFPILVFVTTIFIQDKKKDNKHSELKKIISFIFIWKSK